MSGREPSGPVLVGYAVLGGDDTRLYQTERAARYYAGFNGRVEPVYTLPDYLAPSAPPSLALRLRWFLAGAVSAALVCLAAAAVGGAV